MINNDTISTLIYPINLPLRDYQYNILLNTIQQNVLCAIPTGMGKTFISTTLILNYFNWTTSDMKIIFMAPTKPLVTQQFKSFIKISNINIKYIDLLLDKHKNKRLETYNNSNKRIYFATPQIIDNDLKNNLLNPNSIICIVFDEAHKSSSPNYAYSSIINYMNKNSNSQHKFRVLALTATPGSNLPNIQSIINNLNIESLQLRTLEDDDIIKYTNQREILKIDCPNNDEIEEIFKLLNEISIPILKIANDRKIYLNTDPNKINSFIILEIQNRISKDNSIPQHLKWSNYSILKILSLIGQLIKRLTIYGINNFYKYLKEKIKTFKLKKSKDKQQINFFNHPNIDKILNYIESNEFEFPHMKFKELYDNVKEFLNESPENSKIIIFTELRDSALEIVKILQSIPNASPHIFIGQSASKNNDSTKSKPVSTSLRKSNSYESSKEIHQTGMKQSIQQSIMDNFQSNKYNILVSTSIGEEGLDIGEVDLIICFDSTSSSIKNIQRMGRTGRKRNGKVIFLFSGNERNKFEKSVDNYKYIQNHLMNNLKMINFFEVEKGNNKIIEPMPKIVFEKLVMPVDNENLLKNSDLDDDEFLKLAYGEIKNAERNDGKKDKSINILLKEKKKEKKEKEMKRIEEVKSMPGFQPVSSINKEFNIELSDSDNESLDNLIEFSSSKNSNNNNNNNNRSKPIDINFSDFSDDISFSDIIENVQEKKVVSNDNDNEQEQDDEFDDDDEVLEFFDNLEPLNKKHKPNSNSNSNTLIITTARPAQR